jgi:hypothetical protein
LLKLRNLDVIAGEFHKPGETDFAFVRREVAAGDQDIGFTAISQKKLSLPNKYDADAWLTKLKDLTKVPGLAEPTAGDS